MTSTSYTSLGFYMSFLVYRSASTSLGVTGITRCSPPSLYSAYDSYGLGVKDWGLGILGWCVWKGCRDYSTHFQYCLLDLDPQQYLFVQGEGMCHVYCMTTTLVTCRQLQAADLNHLSGSGPAPRGPPGCRSLSFCVGRSPQSLHCT